MFIHGLLNKDPYIVPEEAPIIILDSKSDMCMDSNGKDTRCTRHIESIINFCGMVKSARFKILTGVKEV